MPTLAQARQWYPASDPTHGFDHIQRVAALAEVIARAEGADVEIVRAAALLHDALDPDQAPAGRAAHQHASAEFAGRVLRAEGWPEARLAAVQHCIRAHRFRDPAEPPATLEAQVVFDADKLDAIGAIGAGRAIGYAIAHGQPVYAPVSQSFAAAGQLQPGEPHSAYHEYIFKLRKLHSCLLTAAGRRLGAERHARMAAFFDALHDEQTPGSFTHT